jgi:hypothetical protein
MAPEGSAQSPEVGPRRGSSLFLSWVPASITGHQILVAPNLDLIFKGASGPPV